VLVEEPGFWQHRTILQRAGLELVAVDVDGGGLQTDALPAAAAALVTPAHQFPTGAVLAPERRAALLDWASAHEALVIEDDYDGEYRYDREPLGALQGLGAGRVAYLGSTSKTLAPALRLGWMVLPGALAGAIADERGWADGGSPALDQLALASFIDRGELDRHLRRMRLRYRRRRDRLVAALGEHLPDNEVGGAAAGLHVTVALAPDADVDAVLARASARGVGVFATHHAGRPLLLVGYANIAEEAIEPAVRALAAAVRA
jgi:GntR family transcriptional regulator / MocR family aminotransferase